MLARLGLFFAVSGWVVGLWYDVGVAVPTPRGSIHLVVCRSGWLIFEIPVPQRLERVQFDVQPEDSTIHAGAFGHPEADRHADILEFRYVVNSGPIVVSYNTQGAWGEWGPTIALRHWFVISILLSLNVACHVFYRKRKPG